MNEDQGISYREIVEKVKENPDILESLSPLNREVLRQLCRELDRQGKGGPD